MDVEQKEKNRPAACADVKITDDELNTVRVPEQFKPLFLRAQKYVREYFSGNRIMEPSRGSIKIAGEQYILVRAASMSVDFFDTIRRLSASKGEKEADDFTTSLLFDIAHAIGKADARNFHRRMGLEDPVQKLSVGPVHFAYTGWALVEILPQSRPTPDENFYLIFDHPYSFESSAWEAAERSSDFPICIMSAGYSSGWCEESFGIPLVAAEIMCRAKGDKTCRFIMAPPSKIQEYVRKYMKDYLSLTGESVQCRIPELFERKKLEDSLRKSETKLQGILGSITDCISIMGEDLQILWANDVVKRQFGSDVVGEKCYQAYYGRNVPCRDCAVQKTFRNGRIHENENEIPLPDGASRHFWCTANVLSQYPDGRPREVIEISRDITSRKNIEAALRISEEKFRTIFQGARDAIFIADAATGELVDCNEAATRLVDRTREEIIGQHQRLLHPLSSIDGDRFSKTFKEHMQEKDGASLYDHIITKKGEIRDVSIKGTIFHFHGRTLVHGVFRDITEQKKMQEDLAQARKLESVGQLASGIAHEINTPTQYVGTNIDFLDESLQDMTSLMNKFMRLLDAASSNSITPELLEEIRDAVEDTDWEYLQEELPLAIEQSRDGVKRVTSIVRAMKEFSHPGSKEKEPVDLKSIIENTVTVARNEWKYVADMELELDALMPQVPCLSDELGQVILNLMVNAAHSIEEKLGDNPDGEKGLITITMSHDDQWAVIILSDTGKGIPEKSWEKVFEPFFTTKEVGKGTGQGLAIARNVVVDKHKGIIDFDTEPGKGTSFIIKLPLR